MAVCAAAIDFPPGDPLPLPVVATTLAARGGYPPVEVYKRLMRGVRETPARRGAPAVPPTIASIQVEGEHLIPRAEAERLRDAVRVREAAP